MTSNTTIAAVDTIGKQCTVPIKSWMEKGMELKFVSDNGEKKKGVCDTRTEFHGEIKHMCSLLAVCSRIPSGVANPGERLAHLEPVCGGWHCLMCFLGVSRIPTSHTTT